MVMLIEAYRIVLPTIQLNLACLCLRKVGCLLNLFGRGIREAGSFILCVFDDIPAGIEVAARLIWRPLHRRGRLEAGVGRCMAESGTQGAGSWEEGLHRG